MKPNIKSYHLVKQLAIEYGAVCQIEANLCMGVDGDISMINHLRLSREELEVLLRDKDISLYVGLELPNEGKVVKAAEAAGIREKVKIMIGGAPVTEEYRAQIGADAYTPDAASAAKKAKELVA